MSFKSPQEARENLNKTMQELNELLKSMDGLQKEAPVLDPGGVASVARAFGKAENPQEGEAGEGAPDEQQPDELGQEGQDPSLGQGEPDGDEGAPAPDAGQAPEQDPGQESGDQEAAIRQQAESLDDSELEMMANILQEELEKRQSAHAEQGQAPEGAGDANQLAMSMKSELATMAKSFKEEISKLAKSVNDLRSENANLKKKTQLPTTKPAATGTRQVLEKSAKVVAPLTKSESIDYLMGKMRSKDRGGVNSGHVATVNAARTADDLQEAFRMLAEDGIVIPSK